MDLGVNIGRLQAEIDELATITEVEPPAVTRILLSPEDLRAREWFVVRCREAGLAVRADAAGNIFARWEGLEPDLPAVATGSHCDAIPNAGKFDGVVGVLGGLEAIRSLQATGFRPRRAIELIHFTSEEPTRFGIGCLGSRLLCGSTGIDDALKLSDNTGRTFADWLATSPYAALDQSAIRIGPGHYGAFVELHIEQGPILEGEDLDIGVVTHIAGPAAYRLTIEGEGGHAGGVLMPARRDALCAASEFVLALERHVKNSGNPDTVGTVGLLHVHPGAINSIPSRVELGIDLRDTRPDTRAGTWLKCLVDLAEIAERRAVTTRLETISEDPPAACDARLLGTIRRAATARGLKQRDLISRAYHDSLFMARLAPTAMIFIPCRGGVSHRPDEFSTPSQIERGVSVLADVLRELSGAG